MLKKIKKKILLIGGGGHARVHIDLIQSKKVFSIHGILDPNIKKGKKQVITLIQQEVLLKMVKLTIINWE